MQIFSQIFFPSIFRPSKRVNLSTFFHHIFATFLPYFLLKIPQKLGDIFAHFIPQKGENFRTSMFFKKIDYICA